MIIEVSSYYAKGYKKVVSNNQNLHKGVKAKLILFSENPAHPSLRLHLFQKRDKKEWSISVNMSIRITFIYIDNGILLLDIGKHEDIY
jgi:mRNA-degrading endonuclease YafQ of YafQ-DinJ toxin-antitoxin module